MRFSSSIVSCLTNEDVALTPRWGLQYEGVGSLPKVSQEYAEMFRARPPWVVLTSARVVLDQAYWLGPTSAIPHFYWQTPHSSSLANISFLPTAHFSWPNPYFHWPGLASPTPHFHEPNLSHPFARSHFCGPVLVFDQPGQTTPCGTELGRVRTILSVLA